MVPLVSSRSIKPFKLDDGERRAVRYCVSGMTERSEGFWSQRGNTEWYRGAASMWLISCPGRIEVAGAVISSTRSSKPSGSRPKTGRLADGQNRHNEIDERSFAFALARRTPPLCDRHAQRHSLPRAAVPRFTLEELDAGKLAHDEAPGAIPRSV